MNIAELMQFRDQIIAFDALQKGNFDTEIKRLEAATKEWDKRASLADREKALAKTQADAAKAQADFDSRQATAKASWQALKDELDGISAKQDAEVKKLDARAAAVAEGEAKLIAAQDAIARTQKEVGDRLAAVKSVQDALSARETKLAEGEAALAKKAAQLKSMLAA